MHRRRSREISFTNIDAEDRHSYSSFVIRHSSFVIRFSPPSVYQPQTHRCH
jgi:hypothetical protein